MKNSVANMVLVIVKLFNKILQLGKFPKQWNISHISSMFKSGDPNDCNNYRGICVSSCLGKLFTSLLQNILTLFLEEHDLLSPNQGGFSAGYRTSDHIFILKTLINKHVYNKNLFVCFVYFQKAFNSVARKAMLTKLLKKGVGGIFFYLIKNMYSNTLYCCKTDEYISDPFQANLGVKQGDSLSRSFLTYLSMTLFLISTLILPIQSHWTKSNLITFSMQMI